MRQMNVNEDLKVEIDFTTWEIPSPATILQPLVFREGNSYHCLLGPNLEEGVLGEGDTPYSAIQNWEINLKQRISSGNSDDEVGQYIKDSLNITKDDVW